MGKIYESLGDLKEASTHYKVALKRGNHRAFNNLGRAYISKNDMITAEYLLRMGLQRVSKEEAQLNYELHQNLGWLPIKLKKYPAAGKELKQAVYLDENLKETQLDRHMAYCLLEDVMEEKKEKKEQVRGRKMCLEKARPETIDQYKWFIETKKYLAGDLQHFLGK